MSPMGRIDPPEDLPGESLPRDEVRPHNQPEHPGDRVVLFRHADHTPRPGDELTREGIHLVRVGGIVQAIGGVREEAQPHRDKGGQIPTLGCTNRQRTRVPSVHVLRDPLVQYEPVMMWLAAILLRLLIAIPYLLIGLLIEAICSSRPVPAPSAALNLGALLLKACGFVACSLSFMALVIAGVTHLPRPHWWPQPEAHTGLGFVAWLIVLLLVMDGCYYWMHRAQHAIPWLWAQHAIHHSDETVNITTAWRIHWTEPILETVFIVAPTAYLFHQQPAMAFAIGVLSHAVNAFAHLNIPWRAKWLAPILVTPAWHRTHHAAVPPLLDRNFAGKFPLWDRIFGTYVTAPVNDPPTGLHSGEHIRTLRDVAWWPMTEWHRLFTAPTHKSESSQMRCCRST